MDRTPLRFFINRELKRLNGEFAGQAILELGTGRNTCERFFKKSFFIKSDIEVRSEVDVLCDAEALPFKNSKINCVLCMNLLEHVARPQAVVKEIYRVLRHKGRSVIFTPFLFPKHDKKDYWRFTDDGYQVLLKDFKIRKIKKMGFWKFAFGYFVDASKP